MKYFLALFSLFLSFHIIHSETLFIKTDGNPLTKDEHAVAYQIMLENQFPTSLKFGSYKQDELAAINTAIAQKLPHSNITAQFISKTLYELFALKFIQDNCSYQNALDLKSGTSTTDTLFIATGGMLQTDQYASVKSHRCEVGRAYAPLKKAIHDQHLLFEPSMLQALKEFHYNVNNTIHKLFTAKNINPESLEDALKAIHIFDFEKIAISPGLRTYKIKNNIITQAIKIEHEAHQRKNFILYRGTNTLDFEPHVKKGVDLNRSISLGSSLFAGALFDNDPEEDGACAYSYVCCAAAQAYALPIKTQEYVHGPLKDMFIIPPLVTLLGIMSQGEDFHARSKVVDVTKQISGHVGHDKENLSVMQMNHAHPGRVIYSRMLQYIKENYIPIKK